jgi:hypothetical protein
MRKLTAKWVLKCLNVDKKQIKECYFSSDMEVIAAAGTWFDRQPSEFLLLLLSGLQKLEQRAKKCVELRGEYVE